MNTIGNLYRLTTYGESHGDCIGGIIDGFPCNIEIDLNKIQEALDLRAPGHFKNTSQRKEGDKLEILSGIFNNKTTGAPISFQIKNTNQYSSDYDEIKNIFRPSHADKTYYNKYQGCNDYRGGGRSSARETANWVVAGAFAQHILDKFNISINIDYETRFDLDELNKEGDSCGAELFVRIDNVPIGVGEPIFNKLDAELSKAIIGINGCKGIEFGLGFKSLDYKGSEYNKNAVYHNGGIEGGISTGAPIYFNCVFKPTPSIYKEQLVETYNHTLTKFKIKGRHDVCIGIRAVPVVKAMCQIVLLDYLLNKNIFNFIYERKRKS